MEKEVTERQVTQSWQGDKLARRSAGNESDCFSGQTHTRAHTPTRSTTVRRIPPLCKDTKVKRSDGHENAFVCMTVVNVHTGGQVSSCSRRAARRRVFLPPLAPSDFQSPRRLLPASSTCPVHGDYSLVYSEPSVSGSVLRHPSLCQLCHPVCRGSTKIVLLLQASWEPVWERASSANLPPPLRTARQPAAEPACEGGVGPKREVRHGIQS